MKITGTEPRAQYVTDGNFLAHAPATASRPGPNTKTIDGKTYTLSWNDEFDNPTLDASKWIITSEANFWQATYLKYDNAKAPLYIQDSVLHLPVRKHTDGTWWSTQIIGQDQKRTSDLRHSFQPSCYIEMKVKPMKGLPSPNKPEFTGVWSGLWMLPAEPRRYWRVINSQVGLWWPAAGEIDILEGQWFGNWGGRAFHMWWSTLIQSHNASPNNSIKCTRPTLAADWSLDWHIVGIHWYRDAGTVRIKIRVDGNLTLNAVGGETQSSKWNYDRPPAEEYTWPRANFPEAGASPLGALGSPFDKPFYLLLNSSVSQVGPANQFDVTPHDSSNGLSTQVDYVRVYT